MANADQKPLEAPTIEAGVTTGGDAGFDPIPFNPSLNIRKYAGDEDPRQWITSLEEVGFLYRWADYIITRYAAMNLVGPAKTWYEFHKVNLATWEIFKTRLIQDFASLENKDEMMLKLNRMQGWNELAMRFAEDILLQCSKVQPNMEEMEKIQFVIGGLKKEYALALYLNPPKTIDELLEACKRIDGFEKEYLERKEKNKILMNRISQKETNHAGWNRRPREFQSYKTENYSRPMMGTPRQNQTYFPPQETRTFPRSTQRDTYRRTPSGNTYDRKPRNDRGRTEDGRPICFRCNRPGHVAKYCRIKYVRMVEEVPPSLDSPSDDKKPLNTRNLSPEAFNAKINCKRDILEYDIVTECQDSNEAPRKIINQQDEVVPRLCVELVRVTVKAGDGEYVVEPNERLTLTNRLRIARCLITVRNKLADLWITNPYPRTLKIMKNQTLGYASPPTTVNYIENDEEDKVTEIQINEDLTLSQKNELRQVLSKYSDLFSSKLGKTNLAKHRIETENAKPIKHKPYRVSPKERDIIKEQIQDMLQEGVIRESSSPWAFPVILVRKRDGNWRFCVDYRKLNSITVKDVYPIPRIDDVMDTLQGSRYFTAIDLRSGYWQVEIEEQDKKKTAFTTSHGLYEFNVMPFGLCNAPATFERIMDNVLKNIKWKFCLCYLDDVVIYSPDFTTHLGRIEAVLKCFRESNLRLNGKKCRFGFEEIEILGHVTSKHGIKPADHNVKAIRDFPRPSKTKEIQSFIGLCSYYRKFIKNFSRIADPLFKLTRKDSPFIWSESQEEAFITLKSLLTNPPILSHFDPEAPTQIHTDASNIGLGATLVQTINGQEKVISYISRSLSKPERNYSTTEKECLALVWSMSKLRPYLYGRRFKVMTDHHALCWLRNLRDPTGRLARWALKIQEYDFEIIYKSGKKHLDADGLSRGPLPEADFDDNYDSLFFNPVIEDSDEYIENIKRCLGDTEGKRSIVENFKEENGCLYKRNPRPEGRAWLLVVPRVRRRDILKEYHNHMICGHLGVTRTMHRLKDKYFWPSMLKDVVEYVRTCHLCQSRKGSNQLPAGLLHPIPAANYPFERVGIDFLGPLPSTKNRKKWMIVLTDYYTKYAETKAVIDATAREVAKFLTENVILKHGAPRYLISDRGSQFTSNLVKEITKICQIQHCFTTSYHPQTNRLTERLNRTLINMISMYVNVDQRNWDEILPFITHAYNTTIQETTKYSPFFLLYGREPVSILDDTNIFIEPDSEDYDEYVSKLMEKIVRTRDIVKVNTEKSQEKMINYYNQKHRQTGYEPGDLVALWTPIRKPGKCEKLLRRYFGPYIVLKKISDVNYSIVPEDNPGNRTQPTTVHISRIKPYFARMEDDKGCINKEEKIPIVEPEEESEDQLELNEDPSLPEVSEDKEDIPTKPSTSKYNLRPRSSLQTPSGYEYFYLERDGTTESALLTYSEAISGPNQEKWNKAIKEEKESLDKNEVWEIVKENEASNKKILTSKWLFKKLEYSLDAQAVRRSRRLQGLEPEEKIAMIKQETQTKMGEYHFQPFRNPSIFTGERNQNPEKWLKEFHRVARYNCWDDSMCLANVYFFLQGTAHRWYENVEEKINSWDIFVKMFSQNFGHHVTQKDQLAENLKTRAQRKEETSDSYIQDVLHLCREVNPAMMENEIVAHLTKGISEEIYQSIIILDIATIDEFIKWCRKIEASNKKRVNKRVVFDRLPNVAAIDSADSESMEDLIRRIVREEVHRALNPESTTPEPSSLKEIIREEIEKNVAAISKPIQRPPPRQSYPNQTRTFNQVPRRQYPTQTPIYSQTPPQRRTDEWRTHDNIPICFNCGRPGHVKRYCRERRQWTQRPEGHAPSTQEPQMGNHQAIRSQIYRRQSPKKLNVASSFEGEAAGVKNPPSSTAAKLQQNYVEIIIDDIAFSALVDSGSSFSVISDGLRRQLKKTMFKDSGMTLKVADGKNVTSIGRCTISLSINGLEQPLEFIVLPNSNPSIILGWDFLEASNAVIDCGRAEIRLEEAKDVLNPPASMGKVVASRSVVIPAESTKLINVMSEELNGQNQVLFEPSKKVLIGKGLTLPCALFRLSHNKGKIWIVNSSTTAQIVPKGMCLGKIQRVEENNLTAISECSEFNKEVKNANHASHADKSDFNFLQNLISHDLSEEQQSQILSILKRYEKIFDKNNEPVKQTSVTKHKIETGNHQPIKHRPYRVSPTERQAIQTEVDKMLDAGIIRHSESPWSSPVILVKKKDGNWRFCVDYRRLNKVTKKDVYPLL
ncbi:hypothetical protein LAZ67_20001490, partial [Cordylochernes scorpioides]